MVIDMESLEGMEKLKRVQLATTLPGAKPVCLVGSVSVDGVSNLAPFSSVTHLGSTPVLLGMVTRPDTVDRHTLRNILDTGSWTLNHVNEDILERAHQCSARYGAGVSEFDAVGLEEDYHDGVVAPFVRGSHVRFALGLEEVIDIKSNGTKLIVGRVRMVEVPDGALLEDGGIDLVGSGTLASTALDTYFSIEKVAQLRYAKP